MKNFNYLCSMKYIILFILVIFSSCTKEINVQESSLNKNWDVYTTVKDGTLVYMGTEKAIEYTKNIIINIPSVQTTRTLNDNCFSQTEINQCVSCINSTSVWCKQFDWVTTYTTLPDFIDYRITRDDWRYMKLNKCSNDNVGHNKTILYDEFGNEIPDFIPAVQPFLNEACNTTWDNLSGIKFNNQLSYFIQLPAYTEPINDLDKSRFTFIYQVKSPYEGEDYIILQVGWMLMPVNDYGNQGVVCLGQQDLRVIVYDELTETYYINNQIVRAGVLCQGQGECNTNYEISDITYTNYESNYTYKQ